MRLTLLASLSARSLFARSSRAMLGLTVLLELATPSRATPALVMDAASGDVLYQQDATRPWYPASTTKLMTVYVALMAVREQRIAFDTPLVVSARAHAMPPSKMGFPVGTQVTLENALKMLMVRSANDLAITVAEGVSGSVEAFADDMNQAAAQLGMRDSHFVNPNGLPNPTHVSSARDMAILARALYLGFPQQADLFNLGALALGNELIVNHNNLLGRYPGADGMKTGFTCAAGFNVVASAYRDGRRLVAIVFGAPNVATRTAKIAALFDRGFAGIDRPVASIVALPSSGLSGAPDMRDQVCRARKALVNQFNNEIELLDAPLMPSSPGVSNTSTPRSFLLNTSNLALGLPTAVTINSMPMPAYEPVVVHIGADPGYSGAVAQARGAHMPIGSDVRPVSAEAYAATPVAAEARTAGPLGIDAAALPIKGRRVRASRSRGGHPVMKASAEAPTTRVIEGGAGETDSPNLTTAKPVTVKPVTTKPVARKLPVKRVAEVKKPVVLQKVATKTDKAAAADKRPAIKTPPRKPTAEHAKADKKTVKAKTGEGDKPPKSGKGA